MALVPPVIDAPAKGVLRARWGPLASGDWGGDFHIRRSTAVTVDIELGGTFGDGSIAIRLKGRDDDPTYGYTVGAFTSHQLISITENISGRGCDSIHPTVSGTTASNLYVTAIAKFS